ncbi:MAG: hypothetical protein MRY63_14050 [Neomegalonema sp.]|nr:hypothetical protein [Neomegalonema sp.]
MVSGSGLQIAPRETVVGVAAIRHAGRSQAIAMIAQSLLEQRMDEARACLPAALGAVRARQEQACSLGLLALRAGDRDAALRALLVALSRYRQDGPARGRVLRILAALAAPAAVSAAAQSLREGGVELAGAVLREALAVSGDPEALSDLLANPQAALGLLPEQDISDQDNSDRGRLVLADNAALTAWMPDQEVAIIRPFIPWREPKPDALPADLALCETVGAALIEAAEQVLPPSRAARACHAALKALLPMLERDLLARIHYERRYAMRYRRETRILCLLGPERGLSGIAYRLSARSDSVVALAGPGAVDDPRHLPAAGALIGDGARERVRRNFLLWQATLFQRPGRFDEGGAIGGLRLDASGMIEFFLSARAASRPQSERLRAARPDGRELLWALVLMRQLRRNLRVGGSVPEAEWLAVEYCVRRMVTQVLPQIVQAGALLSMRGDLSLHESLERLPGARAAIGAAAQAFVESGAPEPSVDEADAASPPAAPTWLIAARSEAEQKALSSRALALGAQAVSVWQLASGKAFRGAADEAATGALSLSRFGSLPPREAVLDAAHILTCDLELAIALRQALGANGPSVHFAGPSDAYQRARMEVLGVTLVAEGESPA